MKDKRGWRRVSWFGHTSGEAVLAEIERGLEAEDPAFVRRMARLHRDVIANTFAVAALLVASTVFLVVGMATLQWTLWIAGGVALNAAFVVDELYRRRLP